jgi:hypothetical protein
LSRWRVNTQRSRRVLPGMINNNNNTEFKWETELRIFNVSQEASHSFQVTTAAPRGTRINYNPVSGCLRSYPSCRRARMILEPQVFFDPELPERWEGLERESDTPFILISPSNSQQPPQGKRWGRSKGRSEEEKKEDVDRVSSGMKGLPFSRRHGEYPR